MTPAWHLFTTVYPGAIDMLARSGEVDAVVPVLLQRSASAEVAAAVRDAVLRLRRDSVPVPVYVCWVAPRAAEQHADVLRDADVPCFPWPGRTAEAVGAAVRCGQRMSDRVGADASGAPRAAERLTRATRTPRLAAALRGVDQSGNGMLDSEVARSLLADAGIPVIRTVRCCSADTAAVAAERLGYPAVVKVDHPELIHKSDAGGVRLNLMSEADVTAAAREMFGLAHGAAVLVQHQHEGIELVVGGVHDPEFGPMVLAGLGGVLVEAVRDVQLAVAPVDEAQAVAMLESLRGAAVFGGMRGQPAVDAGAVADVVVAVSELLDGHPEIAELDLNPVLADGTGCVAVDWRIRISAPPWGPAGPDRSPGREETH
jgi:acyl-CoA synthetase (NDP forming)